MSEVADAARWLVIAARAYWAYGESTGGVNFRGEPMPSFDDLPREIRQAWVAASKSVAEVVIDRTADVAARFIAEHGEGGPS